MILAGLIEALLPARCAACDAIGPEPFCHACRETLIEAPRFALSGLSSMHACFEYGGALAVALARFKYDRREEHGRALAKLFGEQAPRFDALIVPVPLSAARLVERGFNQASILAAALGGELAPRVLVRARNTPPQVGLSRERRAINVRGAFRARAPSRIRGRDVVLVDDVVTTGATLRAAASALFDAGARSVAGCALARAEWGADT